MSFIVSKSPPHSNTALLKYSSPEPAMSDPAQYNCTSTIVSYCQFSDCFIFFNRYSIRFWCCFAFRNSYGMLFLPDDDLPTWWFRDCVEAAGGDAIDTVSGDPWLIFNSKSDTRCISISICFLSSMFSCLTTSMLSVPLLDAHPVLGVELPDGFVEDILFAFLKSNNGSFKKDVFVSFKFFFCFSTITFSESSRFVWFLLLLGQRLPVRRN